MTHPSPAKVYENLKFLERVDTLRSASYRQQAIDVLADLDVSLTWRQAISERLVDANQRLTLKNVDAEDSY
ncbi:hypothetical protein DO97_16965 [Neosynechococcus sphagnicola sy1]|uniref:Uncharacterized protein n=1 Tax=Neosynechococcus sphagnicola sy1 TaxID=1497020 RepID=A0A098TI12_9CYAN|nr:hypothetical protein [Neosynechococcus sphagnicola]KGF71656.1 hypothetical protein DO97_16965 [Neosynechococcus sphagnicola sy1]